MDLFTSGHSDDPILIDRTAPVAGVVLDGSTIDVDEAFQAKTEEICASWKSFYDPESGISQWVNVMFFKWDIDIYLKTIKTITYI